MATLVLSRPLWLEFLFFGRYLYTSEMRRRKEEEGVVLVGDRLGMFTDAGMGDGEGWRIEEEEEEEFEQEEEEEEDE